MAIKNAVRRNPNFRFDYFLRSLPVEALGRRCDQLMKAAEKEVEQLENYARELAGLPTEQENEGEELPPVEIPTYRTLQKQREVAQQTKADKERRELEEKVASIDAQIKAAQARLRELNEGSTVARVSPVHEENAASPKAVTGKKRKSAAKEGEEALHAKEESSDTGAAGPYGEFVEFPLYDGSEPPAEWKKPFTQYCNRTRKAVKATLSPEDRKNKVCMGRQRSVAKVYKWQVWIFSHHSHFCNTENDS
jgi:SWI/SNF-related matrix-associated actin-dependent regulator of chromatin subfamily A member 5